MHRLQPCTPEIRFAFTPSTALPAGWTCFVIPGALPRTRYEIKHDARVSFYDQTLYPACWKGNGIRLILENLRTNQLMMACLTAYWPTYQYPCPDYLAIRTQTNSSFRRNWKPSSFQKDQLPWLSDRISWFLARLGVESQGSFGQCTDAGIMP